MKIKISILLFPFFAFAHEVSLSQAYEMALNNDQDSKSYMYESYAATQRAKQATSMLLPSVDADFVYNGERYNKHKGGEKYRYNESYKKYGITLTQQIFRPALWYQREQENIKEEATRLNYENVKQELAKKLTESYFNLAYSKEYLKLAQSYEVANKAKYDQMQKSLDLGLVNKMDMLESKVRYDEALLDVSRSKMQIDVAKLALEKYVGEEIEISTNFENINLDFFKSIDLSIYENILNNHEYKQSMLNTQFAIEEKNKRVSEFFPTIDFSIGLANYDYVDNELFGDEKHKVETMVKFNIPLFKSGYTKHRVEEGEFLKMASLSRQLDTQKQVAIKQKQAISDFKSYLEQSEIMKNSLEHAKTYEKAINRGYEEGLKDIVDLLDARARLYKTKIDALTSSYRLILSYLELENLVSNISLQTIRNLEQIFN